MANYPLAAGMIQVYAGASKRLRLQDPVKVEPAPSTRRYTSVGARPVYKQDIYKYIICTLMQFNVRNFAFYLKFQMNYIKIFSL